MVLPHFTIPGPDRLQCVQVPARTQAIWVHTAHWLCAALVSDSSALLGGERRKEQKKEGVRDGQVDRNKEGDKGEKEEGKSEIEQWARNGGKEREGGKSNEEREDGWEEKKLRRRGTEERKEENKGERERKKNSCAVSRKIWRTLEATSISQLIDWDVSCQVWAQYSGV